MSTEIVVTDEDSGSGNSKVRVYAFIDGFNLYHALNKLDSATNYPDEIKYQKYKWLCLSSLIGQFVLPDSEILTGVEYFTAYPNWAGSKDKELRHRTYVNALRTRGVAVTTGEFKPKDTECRECKAVFKAPVEKETDINIALALIQRAPRYDKAILLTADSDQVPVIRMLKELHPEKTFVSLAPIGRSSRDLRKACGQRFIMTEQHLIDSQLPNPLPVVISGRKTETYFVKPNTWT
jgi:uncharacterized LabA/DUF88 family protein